MEIINHHPVFFTATTRGWKKLLQPDKYKIIVVENLKQLVVENKIILYAYCIMDNHMHLIWQIKGGEIHGEIHKLSVIWPTKAEISRLKIPLHLKMSCLSQHIKQLDSYPFLNRLNSWLLRFLQLL